MGVGRQRRVGEETLFLKGTSMNARTMCIAAASIHVAAVGNHDQAMSGTARQNGSKGERQHDHSSGGTTTYVHDASGNNASGSGQTSPTVIRATENAIGQTPFSSVAVAGAKLDNLQIHDPSVACATH